MNLRDNHVIFEPVSHSYYLHGKPLMGITGRITERTCPDKYAHVDSEVLAEAAERGTYIHRLLMDYDETGDEPDFAALCANPLLGCVSFYASAVQKAGLKPVASEYIVTDGRLYASPIDKVMEDKDGRVVLADVKTTYTLDREYCSWQLSVYAHFFERCNNVKVDALAAVWVRLRHGKVEDVTVEEIARKSAEAVEKMLYTDLPLTSGLSDLTNEFLLIARQKNELDAREAELRAKAMDIMQRDGLRTYKDGAATYTYTPAGKSKRFDAKRYQTEHPDEAAQYLIETEKKATISIRL